MDSAPPAAGISIELDDWVVQPVRLGAPVLAAMRRLYKMDALPLTQARVVLSLRGATAAVAGALRRALLESVPHACLTFGTIGVSETDDAYMTEEYMRTRLAMVPLRAPLPQGIDDLRLELDVENAPSPAGGAIVMVHTGDMRVVAGDKHLAAQLFNPVVLLATVMPGRSLRLHDIQCRRGTGRDDPAAFAAVSAVVSVPLDLPRRPARDVMTADAPHAGDGDFDDALASHARAHRIMFTAEAVPTADPAAGVRALLSLACGSLVERCAAMLQALDADGGNTAFRVTALDGDDPPGLRVTAVDETHTVMHAVSDAVHALRPDVDFASALVLGEPEFVIRCAGARELLARATAALRDAFESLRAQVARAQPRVDRGDVDIIEAILDARLRE